MSPTPECVFCASDGGTVLHHDDVARVVWPRDPDVPGLLRVIVTEHVREMTDLDADARRGVFDVVCAAESALRAVLAPDKVNLASLGNQVPHVHWHVVPRFRDDAWFPQAIWSARTRDVAPRALPADFDARVRTSIARALISSADRVT